MTPQRKTDIQFLLNRSSSADDIIRFSSPPPFHSIQPQEPPVSSMSGSSSLLRVVGALPSSPPPPAPLPTFAFYSTSLPNTDPPSTPSQSSTPSTLRRVLGPPSVPYYRNPLWALGVSSGSHLQPPLPEPMYSTRRKLADPKTSAMDPELNKRRYHCHIRECGCRFKQRGDLKKHIRVVHNNERKFVCPTCKKCFGERGYVFHRITRFFQHSLTNGLFSVASLRLNAFDLLSWTCFYRLIHFKRNLNKHIQSVHEKRRPFSCRLCSTAYASADSLRRHERSHQRRTLLANLV